MPFLSFFKGLLVVSHLEPGYLWRISRQYDWHSLVLHNAGGFDTNIPQNSSVVSRALISLLPPLVTGENNSSLAWITGYNWSHTTPPIMRSFSYPLSWMIGQFQSTSWYETQAWSPTSYGLNIQWPDQRQGELLAWPYSSHTATKSGAQRVDLFQTLSHHHRG